MKTAIFIKGEINSVAALASILSTQMIYCRTKDLIFNNKALEFGTKADAIKAMSLAAKYLKSDPETKSTTRYKRGHMLYYDAATAYIQ